MKKYLIILMAAYLLVSCTTAEPEPAILDEGVPAAPAISTVRPSATPSEKDGYAPLEETAVTIAVTVNLTRSAQPMNETQTPPPSKPSATANSQSAEPASVDLNQITPAPATSIEPIELPAPGLPNPMPWLIQKVSQDLGQRLNMDISQINEVETKEMAWPDTSLGCPQPDMNYAPTLTPGYQIILEAAGQQYHYHTRGFEAFLFCPNPSKN